MIADCQEYDVRDFLRRFQGGQCDLLRFPGNYGDALIWHGTKAVLSAAGVNFRTIQCNEKPQASTLLVDGGGNMVDLYGDVEGYLNVYGASVERVVILPHTISGARALSCLNRLGASLTVFCRERVSYAAVKSSLSAAEVYLWHDCAFLSPLCNLRPSEDKPLGVLYAFRTDDEALGRQLPAGNRDISTEGYAMSDLDALLETISGYRNVKTDRLHIAIAAALLGCNVDLYSNSYYKNLAVYDYSLKDYPNVRFISIHQNESQGEPSSEAKELEKESTTGAIARGVRPWRSIRVECSIGDIVDRAIVLTIKTEKISSSRALRHIRAELDAIRQSWMASGMPSIERLSQWDALLEINQCIWVREDTVRLYEAKGDFGMEFIETCRQIRKLNDARAKIKREISEFFGSRFVEQKSHAS
jgi:exopolysaccharide biosynthesis predicted pyruvyltransferase EpsI